MNKNNVKPAFATILIFILALVVSFSPANDSRQTLQEPNLPPTQEQNSSAETEALEQPSTEQNNAEITINPPHGQPGHRCDIPVGITLL